MVRIPSCRWQFRRLCPRLSRESCLTLSTTHLTLRRRLSWARRMLLRMAGTRLFLRLYKRLSRRVWSARFRTRFTTPRIERDGGRVSGLRGWGRKDRKCGRDWEHVFTRHASLDDHQEGGLVRLYSVYITKGSPIPTLFLENCWHSVTDNRLVVFPLIRVARV